MLRKLLGVCAVLACTSSPAWAQRFEASGNFGYTFSDGVSMNSTLYNRADPRDSMSYSFTFGVFATHDVEIEFLWNHQPTKIDVTGLSGKATANLRIDNYHANVVLNGGHKDGMLRPFFYFGLGAVNYSDAVFPNVTVTGLTRFSFAAGGGVKVYPAKHVGLRVAARWVPTYIKSDVYGWWCDPYWGCVPSGNTQYSNQFEISGGVTVRFGGGDPEPQPEPPAVPELSDRR